MIVRVYNDNIYPYKEKFRDEIINIPPGGYILMDQGDAELFRGTYAPMIYDADGNDIAQGFKKIRLAPDKDEAAKEPVAPLVPEIILSCNLCGEKFQSEKSLATHSKYDHEDIVPLVDAEAEKVAQEKKKGRSPKAA